MLPQKPHQFQPAVAATLSRVRARAQDVRGLMRIPVLLGTIILVSSCGHMAPYSEHRSASVEMYKVADTIYLRVPYRVMVYDLIPRTYLDEEWIALGISSNQHKLLSCRPGQRNRYQEPIPLHGVVNLKASEVNINLTVPSVAGANDQRRPYKFNGTWALIEMKGLPAASPKHRQFGCEKSDR